MKFASGTIGRNYWGWFLDSERQETYNTPKRFGRIYKAITAVLGMRVVRGWIIEVLVGHCTHFSMVRRGLLCIFNASYASIRKHYDQPVQLWITVRDELYVFLSLMLFGVSCWWLPRSSLIYCYDASLSGFGVASSEVTLQQAAYIGRIKEKRRWKLGVESSRFDSLQAAGFVLNELGKPIKDSNGQYMRITEETRNIIESDRWKRDESFTEIPHRFLDPCHWKVVHSGRWDNIA